MGKLISKKRKRRLLALVAEQSPAEQHRAKQLFYWGQRIGLDRAPLETNLQYENRLRERDSMLTSPLARAAVQLAGPLNDEQFRHAIRSPSEFVRNAIRPDVPVTGWTRIEMNLTTQPKRGPVPWGFRLEVQRPFEAPWLIMNLRERLQIDVREPRFLMSPEWISVRDKVLARYGRRCMCCGASERRVVVDHIKARHTHPSLALDFDNLQVLCVACNIRKGRLEIDWRPRIVLPDAL